MITILKKTESGIRPIPEVVEGCWINVVNPTAQETEKLSAMGIPQDFITYPLDVDERPRIEREDNGETLIVMRIPSYEGVKPDLPYITIPLGVILMPSFIVTVCSRRYDILDEFESGRVRDLSTGKRNRFLLRVLLRTAYKYLAYLRDINKTVEALEDQLQLAMRNKELLEILKYQKSLVYFTTALRSNQLVLERLYRGRLFTQYPDDEDLLEDVITENQQAIEMTNISSNILSSMMDAFASIISNNLNMVMKFLASITIVVSLPTVITGFFGMNVGLPFQENQLAYVLILGMILFTSVIVIGLFAKRDWF
jgi:magnesium transporter